MLTLWQSFCIQDAYRKKVEERVGALKAQHSDRLQSLTKQLEALKSNQAQQLKELGQLRAYFSMDSRKQIEECKSRHKKELEELRERLGQEFTRERSALEKKREAQVAHLKAEFDEQMRDCEMATAKGSDKTVAAAKRAWEEREVSLRQEFSQKEEQLNQQLSTLSSDLRVARDGLALLEKKVADLLSQFEHSEAGSANARGQLSKTQHEVESLQKALRETKVELEISREHYQQQSEEMKGMAGKFNPNSTFPNCQQQGYSNL